MEIKTYGIDNKVPKIESEISAIAFSVVNCLKFKPISRITVEYPYIIHKPLAIILSLTVYSILNFKIHHSFLEQPVYMYIYIFIYRLLYFFLQTFVTHVIFNKTLLNAFLSNYIAQHWSQITSFFIIILNVIITETCTYHLIKLHSGLPYT